METPAKERNEPNMARFRKKPVVIEAVRWKGDNFDEVIALGLPRPPMVDEDDALRIETLEGTMRANVGDWIIRGIKGELYPCKPDIFEATYEPAPSPLGALGEAMMR
jgi:hypothetical protein